MSGSTDFESAVPKKSFARKAVTCTLVFGLLAALAVVLQRMFAPSGGNWEPHVPSDPYLADPLVDEELDEVYPA